VTQSLLNVEKSIQGRRWVLRVDDEERVTNLVNAGHNLTQARLMAGRHITVETAPDFLKPTLRSAMPDPSNLRHMDKAASRIVDAVQNGENVTVFADYDVDGATSAAQLIRWGRAMGQEFSLYVPDRIKEGYGPTGQAFEQIKSQGAELVITLDCGASADEALGVAHDINLPVIVIDHHLMGATLPPVYALVNPNREDDISGLGDLAAAGVTFLLLVALNREARRRGVEGTPDLLKFLDLTALGTICDVVPLTGLNRAYVYQGLKVLSSAPNPGLAALAHHAGAEPPFTPYHGGFILGPRINAGGRIGQADMGAQLLSSDDPKLIENYAAELGRINEERKQLQDQILQEAYAQAQKLAPDSNVILVAMENWHAGVIGIVAGRLKDRFNRPAIVIGIDEHGVGKGSGRSLHGVNLGAAIVQAKAQGLLTAGGGHAMAAGLTIEPDRIEEFHRFMEEKLQGDVRTALKNDYYKIDALLGASAAGQGLIGDIDAIGPYGAKMPEPVFAFADLRITFAKSVRGGHVRCAFEDRDGVRISGIAFRAEETGLADVLMAPNPPRVHIAARVKENNWQGRRTVDIQLADMAIASD